MSIGKVAVLAVALIFASGGVGAALADWSDPDVDLVDEDARKDDAVDVELAVEEEDDSNDRGPAGVNQAPGAEGDGDNTAGNDGTAGGDNTAAAPAPAPAPVPAGAADDSAGRAAGSEPAAPQVEQAPTRTVEQVRAPAEPAAATQRMVARTSRAPPELASRLPDPRPQPEVSRTGPPLRKRGGPVAFSAWGNPWFPHGPPPSAAGAEIATRSLPAGKAGLRLDWCSGS